MQPIKNPPKDVHAVNVHAAAPHGLDAAHLPASQEPAVDPIAEQDNRPLLTFIIAHVQVVVRLLQERDIRDLEWHGGTDLRSFYERQWEQHCAGALCALVADFNGFPIGQGTIHWQGKPTHPHIPDIQSLRVFDAFRGLGIGSQLLTAGERLVAARGFAQVSLAAGTQNPAARRLYERLGYHAVGEPYNDTWHYVNAQGVTIQVEEMVIDLVKNLTT